MSAVSLDQVRVFCDIRYLGILEIECREKMNEHTRLQVKLAVSPERLKWFSNHSLCDKQLRIQLGEDAPAPLTGDIVSAQWGTAGSEPYVMIQALSGTNRMDKVKKKRVFQQMGITYGELVKKVAESYHGVALLIDGKERRMEYPAAQYGETDWELVKRIAAELETVITVDCKTEYPRFSLGCAREKEYKIEDPLTIEKVLSPEAHRYRFTSWENLPLGAKVVVFGETAAVLEKTATLKNGLIEFSYVISQQLYRKIQKVNTKLRGVSVRGTVLEVHGERIKLDLGMDDRENAEQLYAYQYLPITGNAMYAMPEIGAEAELYIPTSDMSDAYVRNCFLAKIDYPDETVKFMGTAQQKILEMIPDGSSLETWSDKGRQNIEIKRSNGLTFKSGNKISLTADGDIILDAKTSCKIDTSGQIELKQSDTINSILMSGSTIQMAAEFYEVSSDSPRTEKKQQPVEMNFDMTEANQSVLAAIPMKTCDAVTLQMAASVPQILSADSLKNTAAGFLRRYGRG